MLQPRKMKHARWHLPKLKKMARRGTKLSFGSFGLKSLGSKWITSRQIEASRLAIVRALKKKGKMWLRIFPYHPITSKGSEAAMGGGKGKISHYISPISPGKIIFELDGIEEEEARKILKKVGSKLPIKTKFIKRPVAGDN